MLEANRLYFWYTILTANLIPFQGGTLIMWASPLIPILTSNSPENPLGKPMTTSELSIFGAIGIIGAMLGPPLFLAIMHRTGVRIILLICNLLTIVALLPTAFLGEIGWFYFARVVGGITIGSAVLIIPKYLSEVSVTHVRGSVNTIGGVAFASGGILSLAVGPNTSIMVFNLMLCTVPLIFIIICYFLPESPNILLKQGKYQQAKDVLTKLKIKNATEHLTALKTIIHKTENTSIKAIWSSKYNLKAFALTAIFATLEPLTGSNVLIVFTQSILEETITSLPADISTLLIAVIGLAFSLITPLVIERTGRKILLNVTTVMMLISTVVLGFHFHFAGMMDAGWVPLTFLIINKMAQVLGHQSIIWLMTVELLPNSIKIAGLSIIQISATLVNVGITALAPYINEAYSVGVTFWIFSFFLILMLAHVIIFIPETKCKGPVELEVIFNKNNVTMENM